LAQSPLSRDFAGTKVSSIQQAGSHAQYDNRVIQKLQEIINLRGGIANITPEQAVSDITNLIYDIKTAINNNPSVPLNQLIF
jgi:hypothetical protein